MSTQVRDVEIMIPAGTTRRQLAEACGLGDKQGVDQVYKAIQGYIKIGEEFGQDADWELLGLTDFLAFLGGLDDLVSDEGVLVVPATTTVQELIGGPNAQDVMEALLAVEEYIKIAETFNQRDHGALRTAMGNVAACCLLNLSAAARDLKLPAVYRPSWLATNATG